MSQVAGGKGVLLVGSYNGQDSLGDKCLLRVVANRFRALLPPDAPLYFHLHDPSELENGALAGVPVTAGRGLQSYYWLLANRLRHARLEEGARLRAAEVLLPWLLPLWRRRDAQLDRALRQMEDAALLFVFGGTNFSRQWWSLNIPAYQLTARVGGLPVYYGTQQYGPMDPHQVRRTNAFVRERVRGVRFRNPLCPELLEADGELTRDEVFSSIGTYPGTTVRSGAGEGRRNVLVNFRSSQDFLLGGTDSALAHLAALLRALGERLDCSFTLFSVSGATFADDTEVLPALRALLPERFALDVLPYTDEYDLMAAAARAHATVSMSFHGCILAMIAGCPAIPVSLGEYYDYKYTGFSAYHPEEPIPLFRAERAPDAPFVASVMRYLEAFSPAAVAGERRRHDARIEAFYRSALAASGVL